MKMIQLGKPFRGDLLNNDNQGPLRLVLGNKGMDAPGVLFF